jgi:hypothetical protein
MAVELPDDGIQHIDKIGAQASGKSRISFTVDPATGAPLDGGRLPDYIQTDPAQNPIGAHAVPWQSESGDIPPKFTNPLHQAGL